jgi:hypothetical protein
MKFREKGISSILRKKVRAFKIYPKNRTCPQSTGNLDTLPMAGFSAPKVVGFYETLVPVNLIIWHHNPAGSNFYSESAINKQASEALVEIW